MLLAVSDTSRKSKKRIKRGLTNIHFNCSVCWAIFFDYCSVY